MNNQIICEILLGKGSFSLRSEMLRPTAKCALVNNNIRICISVAPFVIPITIDECVAYNRQVKGTIVKLSQEWFKSLVAYVTDTQIILDKISINGLVRFRDARSWANGRPLALIGEPLSLRKTDIIILLDVYRVVYFWLVEHHMRYCLIADRFFSLDPVCRVYEMPIRIPRNGSNKIAIIPRARQFGIHYLFTDVHGLRAILSAQHFWGVNSSGQLLRGQLHCSNRWKRSKWHRSIV